jgi:hypothetical protein
MSKQLEFMSTTPATAAPKIGLMQSTSQNLLSQPFNVEVDEESTADREDQISAWVLALEALSQHSQCCGPRFGEMPSYFRGKGELSALSIAGRERTVQVAPPPLPVRSSGRWILPRVHVVNPGRARQIADIWLADGRIVALKPPGSPVAPGFETLVQSSGRWVMPGLIDMHAHLPADNVLNLMPHFMRMFVAHGVTGLREAGDVDGSVPAALRSWRQSPDQVTPRIAMAHFFVGRAPFRWKNSLAYRRPEDAPAIVSRLSQVGAHCIKLYENLQGDDIRVLQQHAERAGLVVMGHVPTALALEEAGIHDAQHFFGVPPPESLRRDHVFSRTADWHAVDERRLEAVAAHCERYRLANTPTLAITSGLLGYRDLEATRRRLQGVMPSFFGDVVWDPAIGLPAYRHLQAQDLDALDDALEKKKRLVRELAARGCDVFLGTDTMQPFCVPGCGLHRELGLFVDAGLSLTQALKAATVDAADRLGWSDSGRIAVGCKADLVVLGEDPTLNLSALRTIEQVILDGAVHEASTLRAEIDADLKRRETAFKRVASRVLARLAMRRAARRFIG